MTIELYICNNGDINWYYNSSNHNNYKPAVEFADGSKFWYVNGDRHREDGPAVIYSDGNVEFWVNDSEYDTYLEYLVSLEQYNRFN